MDTTIHCDICFRPGSRKLPFLCPTDARNQLYEPRLRHAQALLEKDALDKQISALGSQDAALGSAKAPATASETKTTIWDIDQTLAERGSAVDRTQQIIEKADELRASIEKARADIAKKKAKIASHKKELEKAENGLDARQKKQLEEVDKSTKMATYRWNHCHALTVQSRAFLCSEAAIFYGLQRLWAKDHWLDEYAIAGVKIVELKNLNSSTPIQITTAFGHVAHLLVLASHYLSVRLPAEITLPHNDYPLPTILSLASSYTYTNLPFPGTTPAPSTTTSPSASKHVQPQPHLPRPRPLYVTESLPKLAKDDPTTYSSFIEGACLLAYNIAWLCKSQGISISSASAPGTGSPVNIANPTLNSPATFEDITAFGRNLYNLLIGSRPRPSAPSQAGIPTVSSDDSNRATAALGQYSHGSTHTSLNSAAGTEIIRGFRLLSPLKIADQLRKNLLAEVVGAEWELVDGWKSDGVETGTNGKRGDTGNKATDDGRSDTTKEGTTTGKTRITNGARETMLLGESFAHMGLDGTFDQPLGENRRQGTSGWTKVKPRP
jgi:flagellin-like hook-associated protein FlgL